MITVTTVAALLDHRSSDPLVLLTPDADTSAPVSGVDLIDSVTARPGQVAGSVLVLIEPTPRTDWRLDALISRVHSAGIAALLVPGRESLRPPTLHLATRLGVTVIGTDGPVAAYGSIADLLARPALEQSRIVLATSTACARAGPSAEEVIRTLGDVLGRDITLVDHAGHAAIGPEIASGPDHDLLVRRLTERAHEHAESLVVDTLGSGEIVAARVGISHPSWMCVSLPHPLPAEREALESALPIAAGAIRERLAVHRLKWERSARARTSVLEEITRSPGSVAPAVRGRALNLGWDLDGWHVGVYVGVIHEVDLMGLRDDLLAAFEAESLAVHAVEQGDGWAVWTTMETEPSSEDAVTHAASVRRAQRRFDTAVATYVGVGRSRAGTDGLADSLTEARDAARLARGRDEVGRFLHVDRLGFGQLLLGWTRTDSFRPAAAALLEPLRHGSGDLVQTLAAFLDCESSLAHTAAVLGIHRNTVAARIGRVQELLGVDLTNPDERLALHLACKTVALPGSTA